MNNTKTNTQRGNAMIYVLIALALFGFLTLTLSRQNDQADGENINDEMAEFYANELINYTAAAQNAIDMMLASGSEINDLDFVLPSDAAFNTGSNIHKLFHPQGGGLNYQEKFNSDIIETSSGSPAGWYFIKNNVAWTPSVSNDVILSAFSIKKNICEMLNKKITGSTDIPIHTNAGGTSPQGHFVNGTDVFDATSCPECSGYPTLCIANTLQTRWIFYSIIAAQ